MQLVMLLVHYRLMEVDLLLIPILQDVSYLRYYSVFGFLISFNIDLENQFGRQANLKQEQKIFCYEIVAGTFYARKKS